MRDLQERKRWKRFLNSPFLSIALLIITLFLVKSNYYIYKTNQIAKMNRVESDRKLAILKAQNDHLSSELDKLKTERGVEEELRNKFQITKPGEEVLVVVDQARAGTATDTAPEMAEPDQDFWQRFRSFFGF